MAESDYLYIKFVLNLMCGDMLVVFLFFYINFKEKLDIVRWFLLGIMDEEMKDIDGIGSSFVFIRKDDFECFVLVWVEMLVVL